MAGIGSLENRTEDLEANALPSGQLEEITQDEPVAGVASADRNDTCTTPIDETAKAVTCEKPSVILSEIEFDPDNTPRDPLPEGSRTLSGNSIYSDNDVTETPDDSSTLVFITLNTIPVEILLHICEYLEAGVIINTLAKVCSSFYNLFTKETYWRVRMMKRWPKKYPPVDYEFEWKEACVERECCYREWSDPSVHMDHFMYSDALFAAVDVVHLMQGGRLLAAGSRDRYLTLLDLSKYDTERPETKKEMKLHCINKAHNGWIWSMASLNQHLYTGSWDTKIKVWDLENNCEVVSTYKCNSAVLDLHVEQDFIVCGGFDRKVYFIDTRQAAAITTKRWHRQPVLCIAADDKYIISGSEDKTFCVYDKRAGRVYKSITVENYPLSVSYHSNQLWFADKVGKLNLIDATMGDFEVVQTYDVGHTEKATGVVHSPGAIFSSSNDKTIKVLEPSLDPATITTLTEHNLGVAGISYQNGVLASAGCDISVGVWRPKSSNPVRL